jgi:hypothetical protein
MAIRPDELTALRAVRNGLMPDSATNSRTGLTTACRVTAETRYAPRMPGVPPEQRQLRWAITLPDGTDVQNGDMLAVTEKGQYLVIEVLNPISYSTATKIYAVMPTLPRTPASNPAP